MNAHPHDHRDHDHDHHEHAHGHHHAPANFGKAFAIGIFLNSAFVVIEAVYGFVGNSMALLADAGHNLSDVLSLIVAWVALELSKRPPSERYTYGMRGSSILAALFNAVFLLVTVGALSWEAIGRLSSPQPVAEKTMIVVAAIGILVNGVTAWLFVAGSKTDINLRGAFLHMAADALVSVGVVIAGFVVMFTGWMWLDPLVSLAINAIIIWGTWGLLKDSLAMSLAAVPAHIDPAAVREHLARQPGVTGLHDVHIWPMSTTEAALTCHLVMKEGHPGDAFLHQLAVELAEKFGIHHPTIQIEVDPHIACAFAPNEVV